ncbi:MAG: hypothetical protein ABFS28_02050 [Bacteroidota bacterium]
MRFSIQPEPRPEQRLRTLTLDELVSICEHEPGEKPQLEQYFSPTKKAQFIKDFLHYLNSGLLDAKHGKLDLDKYLSFILSFQFTAPLLEISAEKELGIFYRILEKKYQVEDLDLNLHFSRESRDSGMVSEQEAINAYRDELEDAYNGLREVKESVQKRLKQDAIEAIMHWQKEKSNTALAEAFGRSIVIPSFFSFMDKKTLKFYRAATHGITYRVAVPDELS